MSLQNTLSHKVLTLLFLTSFITPAYGVNFSINANTAYAVNDGLCSIIEAIENANSDTAIHVDCPAGSGADTLLLNEDILLDGSTVFLAEGANGLPSVSSEIGIEGQGSIIQRDIASPSFRIFHITTDGNLTINQLTIKNGLIDTGFDNGAGLLNNGTLNILESSIQNNQVASIFPAGGGIFNNGNLTIINSEIADNQTIDDTLSNGGGIFNTIDSSLTMINALVRNNSSRIGGGIYTFGDMNIQNSVFRENFATEDGGALAIIGTNEFPPRVRQINNSTFINNSSVQRGGAIINGGKNTEIFASLFTGNSAEDLGGAVLNLIGNLTITSSVFDANRTTSTSLLRGGGGAISNISLGVVNLMGSIVSNNQSETYGGGLFTVLANFNVTDSLIVANQADFGGGFYNSPSNVDGFLIERSSLIGNVAHTFGGGGLAEGDLSNNYIINSTISGNQSPTFGGGLMLNQGGRIDLLHTAIVENISTEFFNSTGGFNAFAGTTNIGHSIIANNLNTDCSATNSSASLDYNITTDTGGGIPIKDRWCSFIPLQPNDQLDTDPLIEPLNDNGNVGPTHLLQPDSPAIAAIPTDCPAELKGVDQRGVKRLAGSCDVGPISGERVVLPSIYFEKESSEINDEGTAIAPHTVELIIDNTLGTLTTPGMPLTLYTSIKGSAALNTDYSTSIDVPEVMVIDETNWPVPGTSEIVQYDISVLDDELIEGNETIDLNVSLTGPGVLGNQTNHLVTIIDDDLMNINCEGFLPPFKNPRYIKGSKTTIPLKIRLLTQYDEYLTESDIVAPPKVVVISNDLVYGDENDDYEIIPLGHSNEKNLFAYEYDDQFWIYRLDTKQFPESGQYTVSVTSGNSKEYLINNDNGYFCTQVFIRE